MLFFQLILNMAYYSFEYIFIRYVITKINFSALSPIFNNRLSARFNFLNASYTVLLCSKKSLISTSTIIHYNNSVLANILFSSFPEPKILRNIVVWNHNKIINICTFKKYSISQYKIIFTISKKDWINFHLALLYYFLRHRE